jgi:PAS domain S-box-containing protein
VNARPTQAASNQGAASDQRAARVERQLAVAQQITHIGSWEWDLRTNAVAWSDELYRIYGLEPQSCEITFDIFLSKLHPDDRPRVQREVGQALEKGGRFAYPERITRPDGSMRYLDTVGEVARDADGQIAGLIGTCRDVTEDRRRDETLRVFADIVRNVQIGLSVWQIGSSAEVRDAQLIAFNPEAERLVHGGLAARLGHSLLQVFPSAADSDLPQLMSEVARSGEVRELASHRFGSERADSRSFALKVFPLPGNCLGLACEDVTAQTRARNTQLAEQGILEQIAAGNPLSEVLTELVLAIEALSPGTIGSILLLDESRTHVRHGAAPHLPEQFNRGIDGAAIGPAGGSCGTAAFTARPVFVDDIEQDARWNDYRELAREAGLRACWSAPILGGDGKVLGTFALYHREPHSPASADVELIGRATHIARIAIERRRLDDQLRALSAHIEAVREQERTGIAREIHDELGQALTALSMDLAWIARRAAADTALASDLLMERVAPMLAMIEDVIKRVRRISAELRPGVLDDLGLLAAIEWQAQEFEKRAGVPCFIESNLGEERLERNLTTAVFRIFQEALTNVARHAQAGRVDISLVRDAAQLRLEVRDDGQGIGPEALQDGASLGLLGMRERARRLGGSTSIVATEGQGTAVVIELPLPGAVAGAGS